MAEIENKVKDLQALIVLFEDNIAQYRGRGYDEANLRTDFVDKFFEILGWDVRNIQGYSEQYREVVREAKVEIKGKIKAPDYSFRVGGTRKFFVEAKKPAVDVKTNIDAAFQLRRYAYTAKLPLSILTDFEEFAVYDTRIKPDHRDSASVGRIFYCTFRDYVRNFDFINDTFSKEAILKGSFDRYITDNKRQKGTSEVDREFLKLIEEWRETLAKNLALRNPRLSIYELNDSVQKIIDRIIFLRIAEDRDIDEYSRLLNIVEPSGKSIYSRLVDLFARADAKYNSGLFDFKADQLTPKLKIDDQVLKAIIKNLYYPESPFEFSVLPVEILGNIYEQFLGKTIRLTAGHQAKVEEKPEVKKAGGVYYTPKYIVDYIVRNTVGELLGINNADSRDRSRPVPTKPPIPHIKIVDPACGSGSFLLGAYQLLLDWYLNFYSGLCSSDRSRPVTTENSDAVLQKSLKDNRIYQMREREFRLTVQEKQRILLEHIHGVDIDLQAVEVTKLSLLLKLLEGENRESAGYLFKHSDFKLLPDLSRNIKCGNSLIGSDFYGSGQKALFNDDETLRRVNAFDWEKEFPAIFKEGGFDVVIGNPPYVRQEMLGEYKEYFEARYRVYHGVADLYAYFIERGISLLKVGGLFGIIVANKWMRANYGEHLRRYLKSKRILEIIDFGDLPVFQNATTYPCILRVKNENPVRTFVVANIKTLTFFDLNEYVKQNSFQVASAALDDSSWSLSDERSQNLLRKLREMVNAGGPRLVGDRHACPLQEYVKGKIFYGIKTGLNEAFVIDVETRKRLIKEDPKSKEIIKPFLLGRDIKRYFHSGDKYLIFFQKGWTNSNLPKGKDPWIWLQSQYPAVADHLAPFEESAKKRFDQGEYWWELRSCDYFTNFEKPKIIFPDMSQKGNFSIDFNNYFCSNTAYFIPSDDKYFLGILNSKLLTFFYKNSYAVFRGGYLRFFSQYLVKLPIRIIDFSNKEEKEIHDRVIKSVDSMIDLQKKFHDARLETEKNLFKKQIDTLDNQIDRLVYELYGLTEEDIKIVEGE